MSNRRQHAPSRAGSLPLVGGVLALDFCNTSSGRGTAGHAEHLRTASDLLAWTRHAAIADGPTEARLRDLCEADQEFATRLLGRALSLREAIYGLNLALTRSEEADQAAIDLVAGAHAACLAKGRLATKGGAFGWTWDIADAPEEVVLGPVAASAMALITAADHGRLKRCDGHHCGWLFLDTTKSSNRRWCEMEPCGNRAKQKRRRGRLQSDDAA